MVNTDTLLSELGNFLGQSFKDAVMWEQRDAGLLGKYVYLKYEGKEVGVFMGYYGDHSGSVKSCITFFFTHPTSLAEEKSETVRLFHKLLIRLNLRMKGCHYRIVNGRSPAIMRTMHFGEQPFSHEISKQFFMESIEVIKTCEPVYRAASN